jgi:uncharacterized membrane protein YhaH (DUF805 family)
MNLLAEFLTVGRVSRSGFWMRHLIVLPAGLFVCVSASVLLGGPWDIVPALALTVFLVSTWGRRLHDRGLPAWTLLLTLVPVLGALFLIGQCGFGKTRSQGNRFDSASPRLDYTTVGSGA